ncbi:transposase [Nocardia gipuzkoensis]
MGMLERALAANIPFRWFTADKAYGHMWSRRWLHPTRCGWSTRRVCEEDAALGGEYSGTAGRVENCQRCVPHICWAVGRALIDRELNLPESWIADRHRCVDAGVPRSVGLKGYHQSTLG